MFQLLTITGETPTTTRIDKNSVGKKKVVDNPKESERPKSSVENNTAGNYKSPDFKKNSVPLCNGDDCPESQIILENKIVINFFGKSKYITSTSTPQPTTTTKHSDIEPEDTGSQSIPKQSESSNHSMEDNGGSEPSNQSMEDSYEVDEVEGEVAIEIEKRSNQCYEDQSKKFVPCDGKSIYLNQSQDYDLVNRNEDVEVKEEVHEEKIGSNQCYDYESKKFVPCDGKSIYLH